MIHNKRINNPTKVYGLPLSCVHSLAPLSLLLLPSLLPLPPSSLPLLGRRRRRHFLLSSPSFSRPIQNPAKQDRARLDSTTVQMVTEWVGLVGGKFSAWGGDESRPLLIDQWCRPRGFEEKRGSGKRKGV